MQYRPRVSQAVYTLLAEVCGSVSSLRKTNNHPSVLKDAWLVPCHCTIFQFGWNFTNTCSFLPSTFLTHFVQNSFKSAHKLQSKQRLLKPYIGFPFPHIGLTPATVGHAHSRRFVCRVLLSCCRLRS